MDRYLLVLVGLALLVLPSTARAERPPQDRKEAPVVLLGRVDDIEERWDLETDYYRIWLRIEAVERGQGVQSGDLFAVSCFRWSRPGPGKAGATGHSSIPQVGDRIRAYVWPRGSEYEGNYPDWYDLIEPSSHGWLFRTWVNRKVRLFCSVVGVALIGFMAWRIRKRMWKNFTADTKRAIPEGLPKTN